MQPSFTQYSYNCMLYLSTVLSKVQYPKNPRSAPAASFSLYIHGSLTKIPFMQSWHTLLNAGLAVNSFYFQGNKL